MWNFIGRVIYGCLMPFLKIHTRRAKPRVRVLVIDGDGRILMVKSWLSHQRWTLPGGGVKHGEKINFAALRELEEETGLEAHDNQLQYVGLIDPQESDTFFNVQLFILHLKDTKPALSERRPEIIEAAWLTRSQVPVSAKLVRHVLVTYPSMV